MQMASKHAEKNVDSYNVLLELPAGELNLIHFFLFFLLNATKNLLFVET